jgi:hypothetical protein
MTGDMSGVRTRQRDLHFVPKRADGPSLSIYFIHTFTFCYFNTHSAQHCSGDNRQTGCKSIISENRKKA